MEEPQHELGTIRVCYVTSPREIATEGVGTDERIVPTLEFLQRQIAAGNPLVKNVQIAAVFVDDDGTKHGRHGLDNPSETFNYLQNFCKDNGIAFHVEESQQWRNIPFEREDGGKIRRDAHNIPISTPERKEEKAAYERKVLAFMRENNIDVILSDSYTVLFNSVMLGEEGYKGLIINIHPGYAPEVPGVTPNMDALARANFFTNDRSERQNFVLQALRMGTKELQLARDGHDDAIERVYGRMGVEFSFGDGIVRVPANQRNIARAVSGAALHIVDELIDHGPIILSSTGTPIRKGDEVGDLRIRNYPTKNNVVVRGLAKYIIQRPTQDLISENRIRNRAHNMDSLPSNGALQGFGKVPVKERLQPQYQLIGGSNGKK